MSENEVENLKDLRNLSCFVLLNSDDLESWLWPPVKKEKNHHKSHRTVMSGKTDEIRTSTF